MGTKKKVTLEEAAVMPETNEEERIAKIFAVRGTKKKREKKAAPLAEAAKVPPAPKAPAKDVEAKILEMEKRLTARMTLGATCTKEGFIQVLDVFLPFSLYRDLRILAIRRGEKFSDFIYGELVKVAESFGPAA